MNSEGKLSVDEAVDEFFAMQERFAQKRLEDLRLAREARIELRRLERLAYEEARSRVGDIIIRRGGFYKILYMPHFYEGLDDGFWEKGIVYEAVKVGKKVAGFARDDKESYRYYRLDNLEDDPTIVWSDADFSENSR